MACKRSRTRIAVARPRPQAPLAVGQVRAYDFVFDSCANSQQLKCLAVIDECSNECLAINVAAAIRPARRKVLSPLICEHGAPKRLPLNNCPPKATVPETHELIERTKVFNIIRMG